MPKPPIRAEPDPGLCERVRQVSATDLAARALQRVQLQGHHAPHSEQSCDAWAMVNLDGVPYRSFTVEARRMSDDVRFAALRSLLGGIKITPTAQRALRTAMQTAPCTLLLVLWGSDDGGKSFVTLHHHPALTREEAATLLLSMLECGPVPGVQEAC